jgi:hypothetical protein
MISRLGDDIQVLLDCGAVQSDALTVDCQGSLEQVRNWKLDLICL